MPVRKYHCIYCDLVQKGLKTCAKHESLCFKNPANKKCDMCKHLKERYNRIYEQDENYCEVTDYHLYEYEEGIMPDEFDWGDICERWELKEE